MSTLEQSATTKPRNNALIDEIEQELSHLDFWTKIKVLGYIIVLYIRHKIK